MRAEKTQCMIIDDDPDDREIFEMALNSVSNEIICKSADNGVDALSLLSTGNFTPNCIFIDVNMPKMNGIECLKNIKEIPALKNVKVYMYSTTSEATVVATAKGIGAEDFIVKPTKVSELKQILSAIFLSENDLH